MPLPALDNASWPVMVESFACLADAVAGSCLLAGVPWSQCLPGHLAGWSGVPGHTALHHLHHHHPLPRLESFVQEEGLRLLLCTNGKLVKLKNVKNKSYIFYGGALPEKGVSQK